ncbi:MAG: sigma-54-dependent transcriptional regulator [Myxococcota bacterium]
MEHGVERGDSKARQRLLVVDDDPSVRDLLAAFATRLGFEVRAVDSGEAAVAAFRTLRPHVVTLDVVLPGMDGVTTLKHLKALDSGVPVLMVSGHGQTRTIVEAVRSGATDCLRKPFEPDEFEAALTRAAARAAEGAGADPAPRPAEGGLVSEAGAPLLFGSNPRMREVQQMIDRVADTDITVLIRGESGTGKELVARTLCARSSRANQPLVKVNCAALPAELLESELFGFEKGAFTGAERRRIGKFEAAHRGTVFLDEISEMHPNLQAKLLQVLQDGQFSRLGGEADIRVDARVLAATNRDLEKMVAEGAFRADLFYRLNVVSVALPPLRERRDEIAMLTDYFLRRYSDVYGREYTPASPALEKAFLEYHWPGNVRELENLVKRRVVLASEDPVLEEIATRSAQRMRQHAALPHDAKELERLLTGEVEQVSLKRIAREAARVAEKRVIERVLHRTRWNRRETAEILQISYKALLYKMKEAGLADTV